MLKLLLLLALFGASLEFALEKGPNNYVVYPKRIDIKERPYSAAIVYEEFDILYLQAGATIISYKHLLSNSAVKFTKNQLFGKVGASSWQDRKNGQLIPVKNIILRSNEDEFDVAILVLKSNLVFGPNVQIIPMAPKDAPNPDIDELLHFSGWGMDFLTSLDLHEMKLQSRRYTTCNRFIVDDEIDLCSTNVTVIEAKLCTSYSPYTGSPVVYNKMLYGVAKKLYQCDDFVGVSRKVSAVRDWIDETVDNNN